MDTKKLILFTLVGAALIIIGAKLSIQLTDDIPITLQLPVIVAVGAFAGWRIGLLSSLLYTLLGWFLPVFVGDGYGLEVYTGNTVGFILMFPLAGFITGKLSYNTLNILRIIAGLLLAQTAVLVGGSIGLIIVKDLSVTDAFKYGFIDLALIGYAKMVATSLIIWMVRR